VQQAIKQPLGTTKVQISEHSNTVIRPTTPSYKKSVKVSVTKLKNSKENNTVKMVVRGSKQRVEEPKVMQRTLPGLF
jgi:hypothetical protein